MSTPHAPESFRGLLLRNRRRTGLIQRDIAALVGVSVQSVQEWEGGITFPAAPRLQQLLRSFLEAGGLTPGHETSEARELWTAAVREAPRMRSPFDEHWFAQLLAARVTPPPERDIRPVRLVATRELDRPVPDSATDWGEAPDTTGFVGRAEELAVLQRWVLEERTRLVAVLGMGGIGKTTLAARWPKPRPRLSGAFTGAPCAMRHRSPSG